MTSAEGYTYLRTFRYERKFMVEDLASHQVTALVRQHPHLFRVTYPPRFVNNLYLDTSEMDNYHDNVTGAARRRKIRVRWYGEPFAQVSSPMLELKLKDGTVGTKQSHPLPPFRLGPGFCHQDLQRLLASAGLPPPLREELRGFSPVLFNRYHRQYFATADGAFRLTVDSQQCFYKVNGHLDNQFLHRQVNARDVIVEVKYKVEQEPQANRVAGYFPFRVTRNSKYVQGIERVYF